MAVSLEEALTAREEVLFYQMVRAALGKPKGGGRHPRSAIEQALQPLISGTITSNSIEDTFTLAGLDNPDMSLWSNQFLAKVRQLPRRNLTAELLQKLLRDEIAVQVRHNLVQARSFQALLGQAIAAYHHRAFEAVQRIEILLDLARTMQAACPRGEALGLSDTELALWDALEVNDSALRFSGIEPYGPSPENWSRRCAGIPRLIGRCAMAPKHTCA